MSVLNWKDDELWAAVGRKDVDQTRKLLQQGADVNMIGADHLVRAGNAGGQETGRSLLHHAAWAGDLDVFKLLVAHGADIGGRR
jgi:ankyrin repeat protein